MSQDEQDLQIGRMVRERRERAERVKAMEHRVISIANELASFARRCEECAGGAMPAPSLPSGTAEEALRLLDELREERRALRRVEELLGA